MQHTYGLAEPVRGVDREVRHDLPVVGAALQRPGREGDPVIVVEGLVEVGIDLWLSQPCPKRLHSKQ